MTVVSVMKFNQHEGAVVADEQSSGGARKYDIANKINSFESNEARIIMGGSGSSDVLYDVVQRVHERIREGKIDIKNKRDFARYVSSVMREVREEYINGFIVSEFSTNLNDYIRGFRTLPDGSREPIADHIMAGIRMKKGELESQNSVLCGGFLSLTSDKNGLEIYSLSFSSENPHPCARPYETIGSGSDQADGELYSFFEKIPRDERQRIDPVVGLAALLYATDRAGVRNVGVGGTPSVYIIEDKKLITPSENSSRLAMEVVRGTRNELLGEEFSDAALTELLLKGGSFELVEEEMWKQATDKRKLSLLLRGY